MHNNNNGYPSNLAAWTTVAILMVAYVLSFIDRQILNLLVGPIRRDLAISDTEMSLLMGLSFALFYTLCGIPLGRMADNRSRRGLILFGVLVWSAMTAACGLARSYWQFLTFRVGVGVGEAALSPAAYSLIADSFPRERRATAISVYSMGIYLGSGLAFLLGGLVIKFASAQGDVHLPLFGEVRPWQLIFLILGAAGVLFCLLLLAIREPARRGVGAGVAVPLGEVGAYLRANRKTVLCHNFGFACLSFAGYGSGAWVPTFFVRTHGWDAGHVGVVYGSIVAVFGCLGIVFGGRLADYWAKRGREHARRAARRLGGDSLHPGLSAAGQRQLGGGADGADGVLPEHAVRRGPGGDPGDHAQLDARPGLGDLPVRGHPVRSRRGPDGGGAGHRFRLRRRHGAALLAAAGDPGRGAWRGGPAGDRPQALSRQPGAPEGLEPATGRRGRRGLEGVPAAGLTQ